MLLTYSFVEQILENFQFQGPKYFIKPSFIDDYNDQKCLSFKMSEDLQISSYLSLSHFCHFFPIINFFLILRTTHQDPVTTFIAESWF